MSTASPTPSFSQGPVRPWWKDSSGLTEYLHEVSLFLRRFRSKLKAGEYSRSPLRLIRFHLDQGTAWCDCVARDPDPWDSVLPARVGLRHASLQALRDAIDTGALIFGSVRETDNAVVRVFRRAEEDCLELVISGNLRRQEAGFRHIHSLAMRAKLLGFRFRLEDDVLYPLPAGDQV